MKKIGVTNDGNFLVEMTPDEWEGRNKEIIKDDKQQVREWKRSFYRNILALNLSSRTACPIIAQAAISVNLKKFNSIECRVPSEDFFVRNNQLLPFREWCALVLSGEINFRELRGFGKGMQSELENAIRLYLSE